MKLKNIIGIVALCAFAQSALALTPPVTDLPYEDEVVSQYRSQFDVYPPSIVVPTVVEVALPNQFIERKEFLVMERGTNRMVPSLFSENYLMSPTYITAYSNQGYGSGFELIDKNTTTGILYDLPEQGEGQMVITLSANTPVLSSGMVFDLERNVALPTSIEIRAQNGGMGMGERIVLARTRMYSEYIEFIPTTASTWTITLTYAQPLKINELTLKQDNPESTVSRTLRFLAQPGLSYTVFQNPDTQVFLPYYGDSGNLTDDQGVVKATLGPVFTNQGYVPADSDGDGVRDAIDNCVSVANLDQLDIDRSGRGDVCEDFDRDGYANNVDNCVNLPNWDQRDTDMDGLGDECDSEESRITERHVWVPWAGMGIAALVLIGLFGFVAMRPMRSVPKEGEGDEMRTPPTV